MECIRLLGFSQAAKKVAVRKHIQGQTYRHTGAEKFNIQSPKKNCANKEEEAKLS
jgi:hypothetical protein